MGNKLAKVLDFIKKCGVFVVVGFMGMNVVNIISNHTSRLIEHEIEIQEQMKEEINMIQSDIADIETSLGDIDEKLLYQSEILEEIEMKIQKFEADKVQISKENLKDLKIRRRKSLTDLQEWIMYIFEEYYKIGIENHVYEATDLEALFTDEVISALSNGNDMAEITINCLVDGMTEGQNVEQIKDNVVAKGSEWITQEIASYVGEAMLGSSMLSIIDTVNSVYSDKPQLLYLINHLEDNINNLYFACFYEVLALEEWSDELYYECFRKADELQYLLGKIEMYTGDKMGANIWRNFTNGVGVYGIEYHGTTALLDAYGEEIYD